MQQTTSKPKSNTELPKVDTTITKASKKGAFRFAFEFLAATCVCILALEAFFNLAGVGNEEFLEPDPVLGVHHIPGKKVVWRLEGFSDEYLSKQGLRDTEHSLQKPAGTFRIALLGDSATEGMQVSLADTYGKKLEQMLSKSKPGQKFEVINFGCSSYSNGQETLQLEQQVLRYKPDIVVLMYNRGDYIENIRDPSTLKAEPRPYFHMNGDNSNLVQDNTIMDVNKKAFEPDPVTDFLRKNSRIYGVICHTNLALSLNELLYSKLKQSAMRLLPSAKATFKNIDSSYTIQDPWMVTETIIKRANYDCRSNNARLLLVCFPNIVNDKEYSRQIGALEALSKVQNFGYIDLTQDYVGSKDPKALFLKYHFSAAGHDLAARKIASELK